MTTTLPPKASSKQPLGTAQMFGLMGELGFLIALPAAAFGFGGAWLDEQYATSPLFLIAGLVLALTSSILAVWYRIKPILQS